MHEQLCEGKQENHRRLQRSQEILESKLDDVILASDALRDPASLHEKLY